MIGMLSSLLVLMPQGATNLYNPLPSWCARLGTKGTGVFVDEGPGGNFGLRNPSAPLMLESLVPLSRLLGYRIQLGESVPPKAKAAAKRLGESFEIAMGHSMWIGWRVDRAGLVDRLTFDEGVSLDGARDRYVAQRKGIVAALGAPMRIVCRVEDGLYASAWQWSTGRFLLLSFSSARHGLAPADVRTMIGAAPKR